MITVTDKFGNRKGAGAQGPPGPQGTNNNTLAVSAAQNIAAFLPITVGGEIASSGNILHFGKVIGICTAATSTGFSAPVQAGGTLSNGAWSWAVGDNIYIGNGVLTNVAPSGVFIQKIGEAISSTMIFIVLYNPILL